MDGAPTFAWTCAAAARYTAPMPLAVIPWFQFPTLELGPVRIQSFGILSAIGILVAVQLAAKGARELGKDPQVILDFSVAGVLTGVVMGHLVHLLFYHREELQEPLRIFKFWEGLSSMGGLLGGIVAAVLDETAGRSILTDGEFDDLMVTAKLEVVYRRPTPTGVPLRAVGRLLRRAGSRAEAEAELQLPDGTVTARATVLLARPPEEIKARWGEERQYWKVDEEA